MGSSTVPEPLEWTPEHELSLEAYVDRMLNYPSNCPCGCGGEYIPPIKKETSNAPSKGTQPEEDRS